MSSHSSHRLDGMVVILTGASAGIGESTALMFADKGASITLCGGNKERLESVYNRCCQRTGHPERFITALGDVTLPSVRNQIVRDTIYKLGKLDILIGNAGRSFTPCEFKDVTPEQFDETVEVSLKQNVFLVQECVPHLEKSKGVIAFVSSNGAIHTGPLNYAYSISKAALNQLTKMLAVALAPKGIRVNATCPGLTATGMLDNLLGGIGFEALDQLLIPYHHLKGRMATVQEQSDVLAFLVSDESSYVNGEIIVVDGMSCKLAPGFNHNFYLPVETTQ